MKSLDDWPEPVVRVQSLSESGCSLIPTRYIKPPSDRPSAAAAADTHANIPIIDLHALLGHGAASADEPLRAAIRSQVSDACRNWGFFQILNHGIPPELLDRVRRVWREFFHLPLEMKQVYANNPRTYEGYGSRLGVQKGAILDWGDYYFLHYLPPRLKDIKKWPVSPPYTCEVIEEYGREMVKLGGRLLKLLSVNLGLEEEALENAFGGNDVGACLRVNYYPKCPQPELTLGLSSHSDPGGLTLLLPDDDVAGLQVRKDDKWITVKPARHAIIVNVGDQVQVLTNAIYRSVEHRVIVNSDNERVSLAFFYNPKSDIPISPAPELVSPENPSLYPPMTFDEYRVFMRTRGPQGKSQVESLKSPR